MTLTEKFQRNLKRIRVAKGMSQHKLAIVSGYTVSYISGLECGTRAGPLSTVEAFAKALGLRDPLELLR